MQRRDGIVRLDLKRPLVHSVPLCGKNAIAFGRRKKPQK
jgi:hypothetical protein